MIVIITIWMILMYVYIHPQLDDFDHHYLDDISSCLNKHKVLKSIRAFLSMFVIARKSFT